MFAQFTKIRNILIHQGYFIDESDTQVAELRASEDHGDYFELNAGFPILLRDYGVHGFVDICKKLIVGVGEAVYTRLLRSEAPTKLRPRSSASGTSPGTSS